MPMPHLVLVDEAHHATTKTWSKVLEYYQSATILGLTATPVRTDGRGLTDQFKSLVCGPSVAQLTAEGALCDYKLFAPTHIDAEVKKKYGEYDIKEAEEAVNTEYITGSAIEQYKSKVNGKQAILFAQSIKHSHELVERFNAAGIKAVHIDGETNKSTRRDVIEAFRRREIQVMSNVYLFGEGFDVPDLDAVFLIRMTSSLGLYLQMCGRALRPAAGKETAIIIDHCDNYKRHGLPCDDREWTLEGRKKNQKQREAPVKLCGNPACRAALPVATTVCKWCGHEFETQARSEKEEVEGELQEIDKEELKRQRRREQKSAQSLDDLIKIGKQRGYRPGWAKHVWEARQARKSNK